MNRPRVIKDTPIRGTLTKAEIRRAVRIVKARRSALDETRVREEPPPESSDPTT